ncbi:hypothetical protein [Streptomyces sp. YS-3]
MAKKKKPEGHCCCRRDRPYRAARWMGPLYTIYKVVRDNWPF